MYFTYEIHVPVRANDLNDWRPVLDGEQEWHGTAHALGRDILARWRDTAPEIYVGYPAIVEVRGENGASADIDDPSPPQDVVAHLEEMLEAKQAADLAADRTRDELVSAMRDVVTFGRLSKNNVSHRVRSVMSRPTALRAFEGDLRASG